MELVNLKKEEKKESKDCVTMCDDSKYPYGLCLHLDKDTMEKLGMTDIPEVGAEFKIVAKAVVKSTYKSESMDNEVHKSVDLQITDMALKFEDTRSDSEIMYGKGK